jgi:DNA primase
MAKTLVEVLTEHDIELRDTSGGRKVTRCVFHEGDNEASLTIYPNQTYYCFACHAWGEAVKFLVDYKGFTEKQALEYVGVDYKAPKRDKTQVIKVKNTTQTFKFLHDVTMDYHEFLLQTPGAINYLHTRGLTTETIKKFKIGYSDGAVLKIQTAWEMKMALEIGLITKNNYEMMSQRITIPNITEEGQCDFLIGRTVTNTRPKYLGAVMPKPIHGFYSVRHSPIIFIAEGQFDWLTLRQWGYPAAVLGGSSLTKHNALLLQEKKLVLLPDYDDTVGEKTMDSLLNRFGENAMILDYRELKGNETKFDISTLAESPGGELLFQTIVEEQVGWLQYLSQRALNQWFPSLAASTNLRLIPKLQV